jgi:hypothetical protein
MSVDDPFVDIGGEAEIVGVDDQKLSRFQNNVNLMVRNFFGLARMSFASD